MSNYGLPLQRPVTKVVIEVTVNLPGPRLSRLFGLQIVLTG
jgi:hypothetical protein